MRTLAIAIAFLTATAACSAEQRQTFTYHAKSKTLVIHGTSKSDVVTLRQRRVPKQDHREVVDVIEVTLCNQRGVPLGLRQMLAVDLQQAVLVGGDEADRIDNRTHVAAKVVLSSKRSRSVSSHDHRRSNSLRAMHAGVHAFVDLAQRTAQLGEIASTSYQQLRDVDRE